MGCMESNERHSDVEEDTDLAPPVPASAPEKQSKRKKRRKTAIRKKGVDVEKSGLTSRSESTRVTVIWRRWSIFNSTHESFTKRLEGDAAGPSGRLAQTSQISNLSAETVVQPLERGVS